MPRTTSSPAPAPQRESERPATDPERTEETETPKKISASDLRDLCALL
jgi:hypothetical protein